MGEKPEYRWLGPDDMDRLRRMGEAEGYVMCRGPGCMPLIKSVKEWNALPTDRPTTHSQGER